jgi:hypothetical protein
MNLTSQLLPGVGYWLISKTDPGIINSGEGITVTATTAMPFEIDLVAGWNQIGNPYNFNLSWADVQAANFGLPGLRKYDGTFIDATQLNKMEGGFVNVPSAMTLIVPVVKNNSVNGRVAQGGRAFENPLTEKNWQVYLELSQGNQTNKISGFGMHEEASAGYDVFDGLTMPRFFNSWLEVNHATKGNGNFLSKDILPTSENQTWEFSVEGSESDNAMTFAWDNSYFGNGGLELFLWDIAQQRAVNMREENRYTFSKNNSKNFRVAFGSSDFVKASMEITDLMVYEAWPNPATENDDVMIAFSIPENLNSTSVNIDVVDMMGRRVWGDESSFASGYHERVWRRARPESNGMYVVTVRAGHTVKQLKVILK